MSREALRHRDGREQDDGRSALPRPQGRQGRLHRLGRAERVDPEIELEVRVRQLRQRLQVDGADGVDQAAESTGDRGLLGDASEQIGIRDVAGGHRRAEVPGGRFQLGPVASDKVQIEVSRLQRSRRRSPDAAGATVDHDLAGHASTAS